MEKILTIIVPTYNMEALLEKDLQSLVIEDKDLMKTMEVLVVNDGSKDRSSEIAHVFQDKYPDTFKVIDKENGNYGSCINRGLKEAAGKYIRIMDADDSYVTKNIPEYLRLLSETDADLVLSDYKVVDADGSDWLKIRFKLATNRLIRTEDITSKSIISSMVLHSIAYNRHVFDNLNYKQTEGISYTDQEWKILPMRNVRTIQYFNKYIYLYLYGREGQSISTTFSEKGLDQHVMILKSIFSFYSNFLTGEYSSKNIVNYKVNDLVARVYLAHLQSGSSEKIQNLRDFDKSVKESMPAIFELLEECPMSRFASFHLIKWWRENGMPSKLPLTVKLLAVYSKYATAIERRCVHVKG